jgi:hypothetical protein
MTEGRIRLISVTRAKGSPWSLSKSVRFPSAEADHKAEAEYLHSSLESKPVTMGFGRRWEPLPAAEFETPSPCKYTVKDAFSTVKAPRLTSKPKRNDSNGVPGPGAYSPRVPRLWQPLSVSLKAKFRDVKPKKAPSPISYSPNHQNVFLSPFKNITFGVGDRPFMKYVETDSPGPSAYRLPSDFDKYRSKPKASLNPLPSLSSQV